MSRSRHSKQSKKGFDKCACGHYHPCPTLDPLWARHVERGRKHRDAKVKAKS